MKKAFIHVPKTGGTALRVLYENEYKDLGHSKIHDRMLYEEIIAVKRNPYDRFESAFGHHKTLDDPEHYYKQYDKHRSNIREISDINEFVDALLNESKSELNKKVKNQFNSFVHFRPQTNYVTDDSGEKIHPRFNKIYEYKDLHEDFPKLKDTRVNKTSDHKKVPMNRQTIDFINNYYSKDFELLGYDKI